MDRYAKIGMNDVTAALASLPAIPAAKPLPEVLRMTGTEGFGCLWVAQTASNQGHSPSSDGMVNSTWSAGAGDGGQKPARFSGISGISREMKEIETERAGFEPAVGCDPYADLANRCRPDVNPLPHKGLAPTAVPWLLVGCSDGSERDVLAFPHAPAGIDVNALAEALANLPLTLADRVALAAKLLSGPGAVTRANSPKRVRGKRGN